MGATLQKAGSHVSLGSQIFRQEKPSLEYSGRLAAETNKVKGED